MFKGTITGTKNILVIGQSNNVRFEQYGEGAFRSYWGQVRPAQVISFINCAVGGTAISQWQEPGPLMDQCNTGGRRIDAIFFYQGEWDAFYGTSNWGVQFASAVSGWRKRFGNIPVIFAQIAVEDSAVYCPLSAWQSIQDQQSQVVISNAKMIVTQDISVLDSNSTISQGVHLSPESYVGIAERYATALLSLEGPQ